MIFAKYTPAFLLEQHIMDDATKNGSPVLVQEARSQYK